MTTERLWNVNLHYDALLDDTVRVDARRVLDAGCGDGFLAARLARRVPQVVAVDRDRPVLQRARARFADANVHWVCGDVMSPALEPGSFDAVVSNATLHHLPDTAAALQRLEGLLTPGGTLAVVTFVRTSVRTMPWHVVGWVSCAVANRVNGKWDHSAPTVWPPTCTLRELRAYAATLLPGAHVRPLLYNRALLSWRAPGRPLPANLQTEAGPQHTASRTSCPEPHDRAGKGETSARERYSHKAVAAGRESPRGVSSSPAKARSVPMADTPEPTPEQSASASASPVVTARRRLRGISEIRSFFRTNTEPIFFVGPTAFNLLGIDRWVRGFEYVVYYDSWEGAHPRVFAPSHRPYVEFQSVEEINNYLLRDPECRAHMMRHGGRPKVAIVFVDEETEQICEELGYELILPPDSLRRHLDSKIVTTRLGTEAGAPSVPNVLGRAGSWDELRAQAKGAGLGSDLVVQTPYGDSGKTTFFVKSRKDWDANCDNMIGQELKIMKRINNRAVAVEAVNTRHGTIVGPFMTDLTGYPELTPYKGGWCGNDLYPEALSEPHRATAIEHVRRLGDRLREEGYKGFFEVDVLVDLDTDKVYLGELNPRISGASSITNVTAGAYADIPLFLFHLLEYMDVDYDIDVREINERWRDLAAVDVWSQLIMKFPEDKVERLLAAPRTGIWRLHDDGSLTFSHVSNDWHELTDADECFFLRVYAAGDYRFKGADLGVLVTKGRMQSYEEGAGLTERCRHYIDGIYQLYQAEPVPEHPAVLPLSYVK